MRNVFVSMPTDVNNQVDVRNIYPEAGGPTVGNRASALTPYTAGGYKDYSGYNTLTGDPGPGTGAYAVPVEFRFLISLRIEFTRSWSKAAVVVGERRALLHPVGGVNG